MSISVAVPEFLADAQNPASPLFVPAGNTALLIMDFVPAILSRLPDSQSLLDTAVDLRKWALDRGMWVVHCGFDLDQKPSVRCKNIDRLNTLLEGVKAQPSIAQEVPSLSSAPGPHDIISNRVLGVVSALSPSGSDLHTQLQDRGISSLLLCGISSSGCVLSTAKQSTDLEYITTVVRDGCADPDGGIHGLVMDKLLKGHCHIITVDSLKQAYSNPSM